MSSDTHYDAFRSRRHFGSLDGLRGIAIFAVIWHHGPGWTAGWHLLHSGHQGVHLFFAISGFLITTLLLRERETTGGISLRKFYARRALRIFPLYYTILFIYILLMVTAGGRRAPMFFFNLPYFLTYTTNWLVPRTAIFGFAWSLATEEQFYCVWPSFEKYLPRRWVIGAIAAMLVTPLALRAPWPLVWIPQGNFVLTLGVNIAPPICLGVLLAHLFHDRRRYMSIFRLIGYRSSSVLSLIVAMVVIQFRSPPLVTAAALTLVVATCVIREDHWLTPVLSSRAFVQIGKVSYGAYLMHGLVYNVVEAIGKPWALDRHGLLAFAAAASATIVLASLSYHFYESFFLGLRKHFEPLAVRG